MRAMPPTDLHVACLCAAWCRLCEDYAAPFRHVTLALQSRHPGLQVHWIDIEEEAELLGDVDVETFPTVFAAQGDRVVFAGPLTPQPETLQRVLSAVLGASAPSAPTAPAWQAFAARLRARTPA